MATRTARPLHDASLSLLPLPALALTSLVWWQWCGSLGGIGVLATGFNATLDLLFLLTGWRTAHDALVPGRTSALVLLRRAALRFLPMHLVLLVLSVACALAFRAEGYSLIGSVPFVDGLSLAANLLLVHGWFPAGMFLNFWNPHLWIFGAGLFWLQIAPFVVRGFGRGLARGMAPWMLALAVWGAALAVTLVAWVLIPTDIIDVKGRLWFFLGFPPMRLWEFSLGALLRLASDAPLRTGGFRDRLESKRLRWIAVPALLVAIVLVVASPLDLLGGDSGWVVSQPLLVAPLWGMLLFVLARENVPVPHWLVWAGWASVPVMIFSPWAFWCAVALRQAGLAIELPILFLLVAFGSGGVLHWGIFMPVRKWCDRRWPCSRTH
ncbi:MAG: hypothetical protein RL318_3052 [Fibrobacterota bacterium]|jgi:peptidoglycan/LPS O-acetylase OafA/YrhL